MLPATVAAVLESLDPADGPALVYDLARIERRMRAVAAASRAHGVRALFAMKSFPHDAVIALAAGTLDGFDAGSPGETARIPSGASLVSITDPAGVGGAVDARALVVTVETPAQAAAAPAHARLAIRLAASDLVPGPEAVGGVLEDTGRRSSRFGLRPSEAGWREDVMAIVAVARERVAGFHVHHGGIAATSPARLVASATGAVALAADLDLPMTWLDLGGSLHGLVDASSEVLDGLGQALAAVRAAVPADIELAIEPGRLLALGAGFAAGHVRTARELDGRSVRVLDLSRACHLRWQRVRPVSPPARTGEASRVLFTGPTCYEEDVIGEWKLGGRWPVGSRVVFDGVDGYALAWNTGFGGVPPARVLVC